MKKIEYFVSEHSDFEKQFDHFVWKKRFKALPKQIMELREPLLSGDFPGTLIKKSDTPTPYEVYKLRLPNPDANAGKSNGYRIVYIVVTERKIVVFLAIYYKKEGVVSDAYIDGLVQGVLLDTIPYEDDTSET